jgi:hypothetical protein
MFAIDVFVPMLITGIENFKSNDEIIGCYDQKTTK